MRCSSAPSRSSSSRAISACANALVGEVGERRPAPQRERRPELRARGGRVLLARLGDEPLEAGQVELRRIDPQQRSRAGA